MNQMKLVLSKACVYITLLAAAAVCVTKKIMVTRMTFVTFVIYQQLCVCENNYYT